MEAGPVTDWVIQYGAEPCLWACTARGWYRLLAPSPAFAAGAGRAMQRRLDLSVRVAAALAAEGDRLTFEAGSAAAMQAHVGSMIPGGPSWDRYEPADLMAEAGFLFKQMVAWSKVNLSFSAPLH